MPLHRARLPLVALLAAGALALLATLATDTAATPPRPPLDLRLVLLETPRPGHEVPFAVEVTPLHPDGGEVRLTITPPGDVPLVRGRRSEVRRDVARGRTQRFEGALRVPPGKRRFVYVRAELVTPAGRRYTSGGHLVVLAGPPDTPDPVERVVPDGRGGTLVEYDAARGTP